MLSRGVKKIVFFVIHMCHHLLGCYWINSHFFSPLVFFWPPLIGLYGLFNVKFHAVNIYKKLKSESTKIYVLVPLFKVCYIGKPWTYQYVLKYMINSAHMLICWWCVIITLGVFNIIEYLHFLLVTWPTHLFIVLLTTCKVFLYFRIVITILIPFINQYFECSSIIFFIQQ